MPPGVCYTGLEHPRHQSKELLIRDSLRQDGEALRVRHRIEKLGHVHLCDPVDRFAHHLMVELTQGVVTTSSRPKPRRGIDEQRLIDRFEDTARHLLDDFVLNTADSQWAPTAVVLRTLDPPYRLRPIRHLMQSWRQALEVDLQVLPVHRLGHPIYPDRFVSLKRLEAGSQVGHREVVHQRRLSRLRFLTSPIGYPLDCCSRLLSTSGCG
jgi:hypothetical protein